MSPAPPHLLHVFPSFVPGGLEMRTVNLIDGLGDEFRHSVLSLDGRTTAAGRLAPGAPVRILPSFPKAGSLKTTARLRGLLRDLAPDLVLTYNWAGIDMLLAARTLGLRRVIHHEDGFDADEALAFKRRRVIARRLLLPGAHRLIVPSARLAEIATGLWRLPAGRIALIPNGIRLEAYRPADRHPELRLQLGIPADATVIGAVGGLRPVKNYLRFLEACAAAGPGLHVLLVGDGDDRQALEERAAAPDLAGRVHLAGYQADPAPFYRAMDVFALSSDSEQMPVCLLEAMAACLPAVSTDVGDVRSVLPPEQAPYLVPLDGLATAAALGRRIAELTRGPASRALRERLGRENRRRVEESFTFPGMCAAYRRVYRSALEA